MGQGAVLDPALTVRVIEVLTLDSREIKEITAIRVVTTSRVIRGGQQEQQSGYQSNLKKLNSGQYHVFTTSLCKRDQKLHRRSVNAVEPAVPRYLRWSKQPIVWSREDHPPRIDNPGHLALVVAPQVGWYKFTKVRMDGGSNINILYYETFCPMGLTDKNLKPSNTVFHGVVPGKSAYPVGKIALEVVFGDDHDSRSKTLTFEVVRSIAHITLCLDDQLMPSSWRNRVMCICNSRCRVTKEPLQCMGAVR